MPVIRTQQSVEKMQPGQQLDVICTDPGARHDIPAWCRVNGHRVIEIVENRGEIRIAIEIGDGD